MSLNTSAFVALAAAALSAAAASPAAAAALTAAAISYLFSLYNRFSDRN
jgi:hypothetical protein